MKPILALKCPKAKPFEAFLNNIPLPCYATPKIDGIRCITAGEIPVIEDIDKCVPITRSNKPVPNRHAYAVIAAQCIPWLDGELTVGTTFQNTSSSIMSHGGQPEFCYQVFDCNINEDLTYKQRIDILTHLELPWFCRKLLPVLCETLDDILEIERQYLAEGYEGVMVRPGWSPYNVGTSDNRATARRPYLIAIKRFEDGEARVIGCNELMRNTNQAELNYLGHKERSSHSAGMVPGGVMGSLVVEDLKTGTQFNVGSGFTAEQRLEIWQFASQFLGKILKYKWQACGTKDKPRIPIFLGWRDPIDIS